MPAATIRQTIPPVSDSETDGATEQMTSRSVLDSLLESGLHEMNRERSGLLLSGGVGGARHRVRPTDDGGGVDALARGFRRSHDRAAVGERLLHRLHVRHPRPLGAVHRTHDAGRDPGPRPAGVVQTVGSALGTGVRREPRRRAALHPARDPVDAGARRRRPPVLRDDRPEARRPRPPVAVRRRRLRRVADGAAGVACDGGPGYDPGSSSC